MKAQSLTTDVQAKFLALSVALSPENLTCDGEATRGQIACRHRLLTERWRALERRVGRRVSEAEVWKNSQRS